MMLLKPALYLCLACALLGPGATRLDATTIISNTRAEISFMASLWESDSVEISALANAQYPQFTDDWQYIFPHKAISDDGDIHIDMAVDAAGDGRTGNNAGASPIVAEIVNATGRQLTQLTNVLAGARARPRRIFRFWSEHVSERHFVLHP